MISIHQNGINRNMLNNRYINKDPFSIKISMDMLNKDIDRINKLSPTNKFDENNIKAIKKYFKDLISNIDEDNRLEMCWTIDQKTDLPKLYPIQLLNEPIYNINICNCIETSERENIVELDLTDMAQMIAYEMMYRDLGYTLDEIEEALYSTGITNNNEPDILMNLIRADGDDPLKLAKTFKIENSPYININGSIKDYFGTKEFKADSYKKVVSYSCKYAMAIIADNILKNNPHSNIVLMNETDIALIVESDNEVNIDNVVDDIIIRIFGRKFKVLPKISSY